MLSSAEIGTLITALGCGIGESSFDISKLRYHSVILMTDADVDGSHIRTLLLTFFFRQMRELVEKGYLYIAQPPLYMVATKKKELYKKDQDELDRFLLENGTDGLRIKTGDGGQLWGEPLLNLLTRMRRMRQALGKLERRGDARVFAALARSSRLTREQLKDRAKVEKAAEALKARIADRYPDMLPIAIEIVADVAHGGSKMIVSTGTGATTRKATVDFELLDGSEYAEVLAFETEIQPMFPFSTADDGEPEVIGDAEALWDWVDARGRKGLKIQRFKGLGEMNPHQLWETTMNPDARVLRQVTIQDAVETDQIFSVLMGDAVEPRRQFIEQNALTVKNLDI
jgi:DNA gyrase subunit B